MGQKDYWRPSEQPAWVNPVLWFWLSVGAEGSVSLLDLLFTVDQGILSSIRVDVNGNDSCLIGAHMDFVLWRWKMKRLKLRHIQWKENKNSCECYQKPWHLLPLVPRTLLSCSLIFTSLTIFLTCFLVHICYVCCFFFSPPAEMEVPWGQRFLSDLFTIGSLSARTGPSL